MDGAPSPPSGPPPPKAPIPGIMSPPSTFASVPRAPRGPPPGRSSPVEGVRGVGELQRPHHDPPVIGYIGALKPPPLAPPPRVLSQTVQRPAVESIRGIEVPKNSSTQITKADASVSALADTNMGRSAPPRGLPISDYQTEFDPTSSGFLNPQSTAPSKNTFLQRPGGSRKAGAIEMFSPDAKVQEPPGKKQMTRAPRPAPPTIHPSWIPLDQPIAPTTKPDGEKRIAPPPVRIAPNRNRAPPREEPEVSLRKPAPPPYDSLGRSAEKVADSAKKKRRDKDMPEFESSSDDEIHLTNEVKASGEFFLSDARKPALNILPSAWGEPAPPSPSILKPPSLAVDAAVPTLSASDIMQPSSPMHDSFERPDTAAMQVSPDRQSSLSMNAPHTDVKKKNIAPLFPIGAWGDPTDEREREGEREGRGGLRPLKLKLSLETDSLPMSLPLPLSSSPQRRRGRATTSERPYTGPGDDQGLGLGLGQGPALESFPDFADSTTRSSAHRDIKGVMLLTSKPVPSAEDLKLGKELPRGRFSITCIQGFDFIKSDVAPARDVRSTRIDPYIKFRVGTADRHPSKATRTQKRQDENPNFQNEIVSFDILDPTDYVADKDLQLVIEVWNKGHIQDDLLGTTSISLLRFFRKPFRTSTEDMPMFYLDNDTLLMRRLRSRLMLKFLFEEARVGLMSFTLLEGSGLRNLDPLGQQNPYVQLSLGGNYKRRSKIIKDGGSKPYFAEEEILLWVDADNWVNDVKVDIFDEDTGQSTPIGSCSFSLLSYFDPTTSKSKSSSFILHYKVQADPLDRNQFYVKSVDQGEIAMKLVHYPAGSLNVLVERATSLKIPEGLILGGKPGGDTRLDPYVTLSLHGKAIEIVKRTPADKDGGSSPVWGCNIEFDIVDQYLLDLEVFHQNILGVDISLGTTQVSLLPAFRTGSATSWSTLQHKRANGGVVEQGDISLTISFTGPTAVAFPQMRPDVPAFDDVDRARLITADKQEKLKEKVIEEDKFRLLQSKTVSFDNTGAAGDRSTPFDNDPAEFSEAEIIAAFKFIDLDHNNYVGAKEIRHILVCMGELITDEEVDMMISMVDLDGDGQVSFIEFRTMVLHPSPHTADLHKEIRAQKMQEETKDKMLATETSTLRQSVNSGAGGVGLDFNAFQRQKEMKRRESKKKLFLSFVEENEVNFDYIKSSFQNFLDFAKERRVNGKLVYEDFCAVCAVEPIAEYRRLYDLFDNEQVGEIDFREFLLSLLNFVIVDKESRVKFSFTMFDEAKSGYIAQKEVEEILRGNHMIGLSSVQRKADTIMRQAKSNSQSAITINEFVIVSKKFPNILLPSVGVLQTAK